jgi:hypothetical protein
MAESEVFPEEVVKELKTYVYRLIDPRTGATFYVGKGTGNRVFAHIRDALAAEGDEIRETMKQIREIRSTGLKVVHVIHRHGMDEKTAFQVEAALIDAYPGLTNIADGTGNSDFGTMHAHEIMTRYRAEDAVFQHKALLINVNRTSGDQSLYEAVRYSWKVDKSKAEQAEVILAVVRGLIVDAFVASEWLPATEQNFPGREPSPGRYGFNGKQAPEQIRRLYVRKRLPAKFRKRGAANPIKYSWGKEAGN